MAVVAERKARLGHNRVVPRRVHGAVRDAHVLAAVDVHAVAVGVDLQIVDRQVVHARHQNPEVTALQDREVAQDHVAAVLQRDRLVADTRLLRLVHRIVAPRRASRRPRRRSSGSSRTRCSAACARSRSSSHRSRTTRAAASSRSIRTSWPKPRPARARRSRRPSRPRAKAQPAPPDQPRPRDRDVADVLAPHQRVVPVVVPIVLVRIVGRLRLGRVVRPAHVARRLARLRRIRRNDRRPLREVQIHLALQPDRKRHVVPAGNITVPPPAAAAASIAWLIAGESIVLPSPVAPNARTSNVIGDRAAAPAFFTAPQCGEYRCGGGGETHAAESQKITAGGVKGFHTPVILAEPMRDWK
jgi:hypothetical protein